MTEERAPQQDLMNRLHDLLDRINMHYPCSRCEERQRRTFIALVNLFEKAMGGPDDPPPKAVEFDRDYD